MNPEPGTVQLLGLYEGPASAWTPTADQLEDALRRAGAPDNLLHAVISGGRASLEPDPGFFPRGQFSDEPAAAVALALEMLLEESVGGQPAEWFSNLRMLEFQDNKRIETLLQVHPDGVRGVTREQPWSPIPRQSYLSMLREQWWIVALVVLGFGISTWLKRDTIRDTWHALFADDMAIAAGFEKDLSGFAPFVEMEVQVSEDEKMVIVVLSKRDSYPDSPAAIDLARAQASMEEASALSAIELGHAEIFLEFSSHNSFTRSVPLDAWQADGRYRMEIPSFTWKGEELTRAVLRP